MLALYDTSHNKICGLDAYSDLYVEQALGNSTEPIVLDQLHFSYPQEDDRCKLIDYECYVSTPDAEYVVKEINRQTTDSGITWVECVCDLNIEPLKGTLIDNFAPGSAEAEDAANLALAGTGWTVGTCDIVKRRTAAGAHVTVFEALEDIAKAYSAEIAFDTARKQVIIHEKRGADRGAYFAEQLNLKSLQVQGSSRDYLTRLYPIGKDGLTIAPVNDGVKYVSNYQYSTKIVSAYWVDNRYTIPADLMADAQERLDYLSKPTRAYSATIVDLARVSDKWNLLDFALGDTITLLSASAGVREQQRIVKIDRYLDEPERSTCEISNKIASLDDIILRVSDAADTVDDATDSTGAIMGSSVQVTNPDGTYTTLTAAVATIGSLIATKAAITDLQAQSARIDNLAATSVTTDYLTANYLTADSIRSTYATITNVQATYATIDNLNVQKGRIDTLVDTNVTTDYLTAHYTTTTDLQAVYATIANLNVTNGKISDLQSDSGTIINLLSNNAGIGSLTTDTATANYAALLHGTLGDAQIGSLSVAKLLAGVISTTKFTLESDSGRLSLADNTMQVSDANHVRVQLGKDGNGDYNIYVWDASGNLMFDAAGLHSSGIKSGIIRDSMVASDAAINATKIDQESMVSRINGATTLLKSSRVAYDPTGQTLTVAFQNLSTTVTSQGNTLSSQGTSISTIQGQISSKIWQTDIDSSASGLQTQINTNSSQFSQLATGLGWSVSSQAFDDATGLSGRVKTAEQKITDSAIVSTVTASSQWSNLSNTANTASSTASSAASAASAAQTTANSKSKTFTSQPTPPYSLGDLWTSTTQETRVCTTARASGNYTASDWTAASSVTESRISTAESKITAAAITNTVKANLNGADVASIINQTATDVTIDTSHFKVTAASIDLTGLVNALNVSTETLYVHKIINTDETYYGDISATEFQSSSDVTIEGFGIRRASDDKLLILLGAYDDANGAVLSGSDGMLTIYGDLSKRMGAYLSISGATVSDDGFVTIGNANLISRKIIGNILLDSDRGTDDFEVLASDGITKLFSVDSSGTVFCNELKIHQTGESGNWLQVGNDTWFADVSIANVLGLVGAEDSSQGFLTFGTAHNARVGTTNNGNNLNLCATASINARNPANTAWIPVGASAFTNSSSEELKQDISPVGTELSTVRQSDIYTFRYKSSVETGDLSFAYGFVIGPSYRTPEEVLSSDGQAVNLYSMVSILWKAVQELADAADLRDARLNVLESLLTDIQAKVA